MSESPYYKRTIVKELIPSHALGEERGVKVFLPPGYNELNSYPIIYCQDGDDFLNFGRIATAATRLILDEGMQPIVIACVEVDKTLRTSEYSPDGTRFSAYCDFFSTELLTYVEQRYSIRNERSERILAGDSLGAAVSLHLALDFPNLFQKAIFLSGAFYPSTLERITAESDLSLLDLYMVIGLQETAVKTSSAGEYDFLEANQSAYRLLQERKAKVHYSEKNGEHKWGFWQNEIPKALNYFFNGFI